MFCYVKFGLGLGIEIDVQLLCCFNLDHNRVPMLSVARFAQLTATIFLHKGVKVYLFSKICPTPYVVRQLYWQNITFLPVFTAFYRTWSDILLRNYK